ncbi:MAG: CsbD family protein [Chloroflexota bacterium]
MSDRIDELKGDVKKGLGGLIGNEQMGVEGEVQSDVAKAKRKTKGALREADGAVKEGFGKLTGNEVTQAEGTAKKLHGKAEQAG